MVVTTFTKVIMNSGKEYEFNEHPEDFIKRFYDEDTGRIKEGLIHGNGFSIVTTHISSIVDKEVDITVKHNIPRPKTQKQE